MEILELRQKTERGTLVRSTPVSMGKRLERLFVVTVNRDNSINLYSYFMSHQTKGWFLLSKSERLSMLDAISKAREME
jgi:hypothetical protein